MSDVQAKTIFDKLVNSSRKGEDLHGLSLSCTAQRASLHAKTPQTRLSICATVTLLKVIPTTNLSVCPAASSYLDTVADINAGLSFLLMELRTVHFPVSPSSLVSVKVVTKTSMLDCPSRSRVLQSTLDVSCVRPQSRAPAPLPVLHLWFTVLGIFLVRKRPGSPHTFEATLFPGILGQPAMSPSDEKHWLDAQAWGSMTFPAVSL